VRVIRNFIKKFAYICISLALILSIGYFYRSWYLHERELVSAAINKQETSKPDSSASADSKKTPIVVTEFDPSGKFSENMKSTDVLNGSYPIEEENGKKQVWVRQNSFIYLKEAAGKKLVIQGFIPFSYHKKAHNELKEVVISVLVNGNELDRLAFNEDKQFEVVIDRDKLQSQTKDHDFLLDLKVSSEYIPSKIGSGNDERELAIIISSIRIK
jgi:hypothetical protein